MNWRRWKLGLVVASATGALAGLVGLAVGITLKQAAWIVALSVSKDMLLYLTDSGYREKILASLPVNDEASKAVNDFCSGATQPQSDSKPKSAP